MAYSSNAGVTGAQSNCGPLVAPTITWAVDKAPSHLGVQYAATAVGGTVPGLSINSPSIPFTFTLTRPAVLKTAAPQARNSKVLIANHRNLWPLVIRKGGALDASEGIYSTAFFRGVFDIPAGFEVESSAELAGLITALAWGVGSARSQMLYDTFVSGVI